MVRETITVNAVAIIFRRPLVVVNLIPLDYFPMANQGDLFIPKKLWLRDEHRFLRFPEILVFKSGRGFHYNEEYEKRGIEIIDNTPEEITAVTIEMEERLGGVWKKTEEDEELQRRFWALFRAHDLHQLPLSRIGAEFLRQNRDLIECNKVKSL